MHINSMYSIRKIKKVCKKESRNTIYTQNSNSIFAEKNMIVSPIEDMEIPAERKIRGRQNNIRLHFVDSLILYILQVIK